MKQKKTFHAQLQNFELCRNSQVFHQPCIDAKSLGQGVAKGSLCCISSGGRKMGRKLDRRSPGAMEERWGGQEFLGSKCKVLIYTRLAEDGNWSQFLGEAFVPLIQPEK